MEVKEFVIDLFCGAGGTSEGVFLSDAPSIVTACVNHDAKAIESHRKNHPYAKHFIEDIRNPEVVWFLKLRVDTLRKLYPNCIITIWASLECTNFSKAKGGLPRDADSRTLAEHLYMYLDWLNPDYLMIENVREFQAWGALDKNGKPIASEKGKHYKKWVSNIESRGYRYEYRHINAADLGAYTSRIRYFSQFAKGKLPITWPVQTHAKNPTDIDGLKKWKPVREVLDFSIQGKSVLNRKKALVDKTLERIYQGLVKFVADGVNPELNGKFLLKYNSTNGKTGKHIPPSLNNPSPTVATQNRLGLVEPEFNFLTGYYSTGGSQINSTDQPCPTVSTKDRFSQISVFLTHYYSGGGQLSSVDGPHPTVLGVPKSNLNEVHYIYDPSFNNKGRSVDEPSPVVLASQGKKPLGLIKCKTGTNFKIPVYENDSETAVKIKKFMALYGIVDIKMRMLSVEELLRIQGFPEGYELVGNVTERKKFIGNSVEVTTAKKLFEAHYNSIKNYLNQIKNVA